MATRRTRKPLTPLGHLIAERLAIVNKTQAWLAEQAGVSKQAVQKWVYGDPHQKRAALKRSSAVRVAHALGIPVELVHAAMGDEASGNAIAPLAVASGPVEWRLVEAYRRADERLRLAVRLLLGIEGSEQPSDRPASRVHPPPTPSINPQASSRGASKKSP